MIKMVLTFKQRFNKKYGFDKDESHSLKNIAKISGYKLSGLQMIFNKGVGAYKTNPASVRPTVVSPEQWAFARVYSAVMKGPTYKFDKDLLIKK